MSNTWDDRRRRASDYMVPWVESTISLEGRTVLEYGCGHAPVSSAFAERAGRVIGVDIDEQRVDVGARLARERGLDNVELHAYSEEEVLEAVAGLHGEIDVFLLYAVLEHLSVSERLELLRVARDVTEPHGAIVVCETPNRLFWQDHHTSQLPFFHLLPEELALLYYNRSERPEFLNAFGDATRGDPEEATETLERWGRGVSYHEFELVFPELADHVVACNYDPILFPERPVQPEELALARYLERVRPDLAPVFSRSWLDLILTPWPHGSRPAFMRPWTMETEESPEIGWTRWDNLHVRDAGHVLKVELPRATERLAIGVLVDAETVAVRAKAEGAEHAAEATVAGRPRETRYALLELLEPARRVELTLSMPGYITFVGYEAA